MIKIRGIIAAMVTPMLENEAVDVEGLKRLVKRLLDARVHALFCLGTTGEFYSLSDSEKELIVRTVVEEVDGKVPVYVGTGGVSTRGVINLNKKIEKMGVDAVSVITPFFITPSQEELFIHYKAIAEESSLPVILYNIPIRTGVHLEAETVVRLSEVDNIVGIKDSSGKFENIKSYIDLTKKDFQVLAGSDSLIYRTLEAGGVGAIAATSNIVPELVVSIYENFVHDRRAEAKISQEKLGPLCDALKFGTVPGVLKEAVNQMGIQVGPCRKPIIRLDGEALDKLKEVLDKHYFRNKSI